MRHTSSSTYKGYCVYCGKKAEKDFYFEDYTQYNYSFCTCKEAKKEIQIRDEVKDLVESLPQGSYKVRRDIEFKVEMDRLKKEYPEFFKE